MLHERVGDIVTGVPLTPIDSSNAGVLPAAGSLGGKPLTGLRAHRGMQSHLMAIALASGGGSDTVNAKMQESDPPKISDNINAYDGTDDGSEKLREGATTDVKLGIKFTPATTRTIYSVKLQLSHLGAIAAGKTVWVTIETDSTGDPSGTAVGGPSRKVLCSAIAATRGEVTFYFDVGVDLTAATAYWIVIQGDYTASATNCIQVHYNTVVGTSNNKTWNGSAWAQLASGNEDIWFRMEYLTFTDISGYTHAQIAEGWTDIFNTLERKEWSLESVKDTIRAYYTTTGSGTFTMLHFLTYGLPDKLPVV